MDSYEIVFSLAEELLSAEFRCVVHSKQEFRCAATPLIFSTMHLPFLQCALCIHTSLLLSTVHLPFLQCASTYLLSSSVHCAVCIHLSAPPEYISLLVCCSPTTSSYQQSSSFADAPNSQSNVGSLQQVSQIIRNQTNRRTNGAHIRTTKAPVKCASQHNKY